MATVTFQPLSILQETLNQNPGQQPAPAVPSLNPNQAQDGAAPQDTVILTGKIAEAQINGQNANGSQFQETAMFFAAQEIFIGQGGQGTNAPEVPPVFLGQEQPTRTSQTPPQAAGPGATPAETADPAIAAAIAANTQGAGNTANPADQAAGVANTPQQELQQLDQTLQQLGINPQSITLFNRMAMLLYAKDPAALRVLVQALQGAAQPAGQGGANNSATQATTQTQAQALPQNSGQAPPANQAQVQAQLQLADSAPAQNQGANTAGGATVDFVAAQLTFNEVQETIQENAAPNQGGQANTPANNSGNTGSAGNARQANGAAIQYEALQLNFAEVAIQEFLPGNGTNANASEQGQALNVTA
jgi:hypothetical protein